MLLTSLEDDVCEGIFSKHKCLNKIAKVNRSKSDHLRAKILGYWGYILPYSNCLKLNKYHLNINIYVQKHPAQ